MHNHDGKDDSWMMWVMMICCAVPGLLFLFYILGGKTLGSPGWVVGGGIVVMVIAHFFMMGRSRKDPDEKESTAEETEGNKDSKDHSDHGCCH